MAPSFLSLVSLYQTYLRHCFVASGLSRQTITIENETAISLWAPNPNIHKNTISRDQKPSLLLLHGFGPMAIWQWRKQVQFFSPYFDLYVPDLVFFGDSTTKSSDRTEIFQAVSIGKMVEKIGLKRFYVMGTSYGGFVAYHMARMWPERVEKVVIASSGVNMRRRDNEDLLKRANVERVEDLLLPATAEQLRTLMSVAVSNRLPDMLPDFFLNDFIHKLYLENRKEKMELLKGLTLGRDDDTLLNLSPLQQEVLLIWGEQDHLFPVEMAYELREAVGEKVKLEVIKNASHVPQIESPALFNNIVKSFLSASS